MEQVIPPAAATVARGQGSEEGTAMPSGADIQPPVPDGMEAEPSLVTDIDGVAGNEVIYLFRGEGESRPLDWQLYTVINGEQVKVYEHTGVPHGEVVIDGPRIVEHEGVYSPDDDPCCPSQVKSTYYVWQGGSLVVSKVEIAPAGAFT